MNVRIFENVNGTVSIMRLNPKYYPSGTTADFNVETAKNLNLGTLPFFDISENDIPKDRTSRKTWKVQIKNGHTIIE